MLSSRLVEARPVRTVPSLWRKSSITFSILLLVSLLTSLTILSSEKIGSGEWGMGNGEMRNEAKEVTYLIPAPHSLLPIPDLLFGARSRLRPDERAHAFACHRAFDIAWLGHIEDEDRQIVIFAERDRGGVHHRELFLQDSHVAKLVYLDCVRVFSGVGCKDAANAGRLHNDVGLNLQRAHSRRSVGGEERLSDAGGENDHAAFFDVADGAAADERLGDFAHLYRGDDAGEDVQLFERVLQRDGVHHRRQHSHVIGGGAIHSRRARLQPAKDVSPADDQRDFDAQIVHLFDFLRYAENYLGVDPISDLPH